MVVVPSIVVGAVVFPVVEVLSDYSNIQSGRQWHLKVYVRPIFHF